MEVIMSCENCRRLRRQLEDMEKQLLRRMKENSEMKLQVYIFNERQKELEAQIKEISSHVDVLVANHKGG
jgi:hypothetical protein